MASTWQVGKLASGGYVATLILKCVRGELLAASKEGPLPGQKRAPNPHPDILTCNAHFMAKTELAPFRVAVDILKSGGSTTTVSASFLQQGTERIRLMATCGNVAAASKKGPSLSGLGGDVGSMVRPSLPPLHACVRLDGGDNTPQSVRSRVHMFVPPSSAAPYQDCRKTRPDGTYDEEMLLKRTHAVQGGKGKASYSGYCVFEPNNMELSPQYEPTLFSSPLLLDAGIPPILGAYVTGWVPTINWTVQFKQHPCPGALTFTFETSTVVGGFLEEDGKLWDSKGNLVAISRQLALVGVSQTSKTAAKL